MNNFFFQQSKHAKGLIQINCLLYCLLFFPFTHVYGANPPHNEITQELFHLLSEGFLSQNQYYYIIKELENEPTCEKTEKILEKYHGSSLNIRNLMVEYCPDKTTKKNIGKKNQPNMAGSYIRQFTPENTGHVRYQLRTGIIHPNLNFRMALRNNTIHHRYAIFSTPHFSFQAGHIKPPSLPFLSERPFWLHQNSKEESYGFLFSKQKQLNGFILTFPKTKNEISIYGSWNKGDLNNLPLDALLYGAHWTHQSDYFKIKFQSQLSRFEFHSGEKPSFITTGLHGVSKGIPHKIKLGLIQSSTTRFSGPISSNRFMKGILAYGIFEEQSHLLKLKTFQAGANWTNPLGSPLFRSTEQFTDQIPCKGGGEGGIHLISHIPLPSSGLKKVKFSSQLRYHWHLVFSEFRYTHWDNQLSVKHNGGNLRLNSDVFIRDSTRYQGLGIHLKKTWGNYAASVRYRHKFGSHSGTTPHPINVQMDILKGSRQRFKIKLRAFDVFKGLQKWQGAFYQQFILGRQYTFSSSATFPLRNYNFQKDFSIHFRLHYQFPLSHKDFIS